MDLEQRFWIVNPSGLTYPSAPFAKCSPGFDGWETSQRSLLSGWIDYSSTWPKSGILVNGDAYDCEHWIHNGPEAVIEWPTPDAGVFNFAESPEHWDRRTAKHKKKGINTGKVLAVEVKRYSKRKEKVFLTPEFSEALMGFPIGWTDVKEEVLNVDS